MSGSVTICLGRKLQEEKHLLIYAGDVSMGWQTKEIVGAGKGNWCIGVSGDDTGEIKVGGGALISAPVYEQLATAN